MRSIFTSLVLIGCCMAATLSGETARFAEPMPAIDVSDLDKEWQALFDSMHAVERVEAPFVEARTFAFRKRPKEYRGVFRKDMDGWVSLVYTQPEVMALHIGAGVAFYRKGDGAVRRIPQSNSLTLFPQLLNFDLARITRFYRISGSLQAEHWQLVFDANADAAGDVSYRKILISGEATAVQRIELIKSAKQSVIIEMGEPVYPEFYLPEIKEKYFFGSDTK